MRACVRAGGRACMKMAGVVHSSTRCRSYCCSPWLPLGRTSLLYMRARSSSGSASSGPRGGSVSRSSVSRISCWNVTHIGQIDHVQINHLQVDHLQIYYLQIYHLHIDDLHIDHLQIDNLDPYVCLYAKCSARAVSYIFPPGKNLCAKSCVTQIDG